jgi:hypothetical protein
MVGSYLNALGRPGINPRQSPDINPGHRHVGSAPARAGPLPSCPGRPAPSQRCRTAGPPLATTLNVTIGVLVLRVIGKSHSAGRNPRSPFGSPLARGSGGTVTTPPRHGESAPKQQHRNVDQGHRVPTRVGCARSARSLRPEGRPERRQRTRLSGRKRVSRNLRRSPVIDPMNYGQHGGRSAIGTQDSRPTVSSR